jgi:RHS repeat-associated protein
MNGGANDPHTTFGYSLAHELQTEANTDPDYVWQPPAASTTTYAAANNLNQYPSVNGTSFGYDPKGNLTGDGTWSFGYDAENRMLTANKTAGGTVAASYTYDPLGRRTHKSGTGVTERAFLNDGDDAVLDYDGSNKPVAFYVPGPAIDEPIVMSTPNGNGTYTNGYFHTNHQGSVIATSDDTGARKGGPYVYDPYGNCFKGISCASLGTLPFAFTGQRLDPETGLYYYRARMYSPVLGRFPQTDPVGYTADLNLYTYVGNNPTNRTDPNGDCDDVNGCGEAAVQSQQILNSPAGQEGQLIGAVGGILLGGTLLGGAEIVGAILEFGGAGLASEGGAGAGAAAAGGAGIKGLSQMTKAERMIANAAQGRAGEAATEAKLGDTVAGKQVSFKTSDSTRTRADFVTKDKGVVESKTGGAELNSAQKKLHEDIKAGRQITPVGGNAAKAGLEPGKPTTMTSCNVDRPC